MSEQIKENKIRTNEAGLQGLTRQQKFILWATKISHLRTLGELDSKYQKSLIHVLRVVISHYLYLFTNFSVDVM